MQRNLFCCCRKYKELHNKYKTILLNGCLYYNLYCNYTRAANREQFDSFCVIINFMFEAPFLGIYSNIWTCIHYGLANKVDYFYTLRSITEKI